MKKLLFLLASIIVLSGCGTVPLTGRKQILLVSDQEVLSSSLTQYKEYMQTAPKSSSSKWAAMVTRVGKNIAAATERYLREMPGGKIVVYEGLMNLVSSDDELAVVLGHEVAHAVAKHSNERMSQQVLAQYGAQILNRSLSEKSTAVQALASTVYGIGAQVGVMLPFSRKHESEADYMGLILMKMAGYNPDVAVTFWQKMSAGTTGSVPALLSTHPSDAQRIKDIQKALPAIKAKY